MFGSSLMMMRGTLPEAQRSAGEAALELLPVLAAAAWATGTCLTLSTAGIDPFWHKGWQQAQSEGTLRGTLVHLDAAPCSLKFDGGCLAAVTQLSALRHLCLVLPTTDILMPEDWLSKPIVLAAFQLPQLRSLEIRGGSGPVLAGFLGMPGAFPKLRHLCLQNALLRAGQLLQPGVLGGVSGLRRLSLRMLGHSRCSTPELPPLTGLTKLTRLELGKLCVLGVGGLRGFVALQELRMSPGIALTPQMVDDMAALPKLVLVDMRRDAGDFKQHDRSADGLDELERLARITEQTGGQLLVDEPNVDRRFLDEWGL